MRVPSREDVEKILNSGGPTQMELESPPKFQPGDQVRVNRNYTNGHTRAPAYVQGCIGEIAMHHGGHVFPDANVKGQLQGEHLYAVRFSSKNLWGYGNDNSEVTIDLWEPYLAKA
ncbi:MAG: nitrile hydratase subunit beta [Gammaproteobacteria bacterium]|nr:nitrile hydratase subunit beta [Gammaproteobacteria bacterium]